MLVGAVIKGTVPWDWYGIQVRGLCCLLVWPVLLLHAHAREGHGGGQIGLDGAVMLLAGARLREAFGRLGHMYMLVEGDALVAGQEVTPGKGGSTLARADKGLLLGIWGMGRCR